MRYEFFIPLDDASEKYNDQLIVALVRHGFDVYLDWDQKNIVTHIDHTIIEEIKEKPGR